MKEKEQNDAEFDRLTLAEVWRRFNIIQDKLEEITNSMNELQEFLMALDNDEAAKQLKRIASRGPDE